MDADDLEIERLLEEFETKGTPAPSAIVASQPPPPVPTSNSSSKSSKDHHHRHKHHRSGSKEPKSSKSSSSKHESSSTSKHSHKRRRHSPDSDDGERRRKRDRTPPSRSSAGTSNNNNSAATRDFVLDLKQISRSSETKLATARAPSSLAPPPPLPPPPKKQRSSEKEENSRHRSSSSSSKANRTRERERSPELTPEERDARTILCMQLAARIRPRDLEEFFAEANIGKVRDARLITDPRTKRSKGVAYVEFRDLESVAKAIALTGQKVLNIPIIIKASNAEKNRLAAQNAANAATFGGATAPQPAVPAHGPMKLYVGSLHFNITEDMLRGIFEPFGRVDMITLMKDEAGRSRGYAFVQYAHADDAKRAMENLNGFELAGRPMKVGHVTERQNDPSARGGGSDGGGGGSSSSASKLDSEEVANLGPSGRLALMAKLSQGSGLTLPQNALDALQAAQMQSAYPLLR